MSAATETPDISQLKAFALGLDSLDVHQHGRDSTGHASTSNATHKAAVNHAAPGAVPHLNNHPPLSLPSTVPESVKTKMQTTISQSPRDTQSASQWVYDAFASNPSQNKAPGDGGASTAGSAGDERIGDQATEALAGEDFFSSQINEEIELPSQDICAEPFPENKRFRQPKTPASQSRKRKRAANEEPDELETPVLPKNPFANRQQTTAILGPSQLFNATQAQTSPLNLVSDAFSDRPSPNVQRPQTADSATSPPLPLHPNVTWIPNEPQTTYVSMKQSQEAREQARRLEEEAYSPDELSDDEFAQPDSYLRRRLERKRIDDIARQKIDGLMSRTQFAGPISIRKRKGRIKEKVQSSPLPPQRDHNDITVISDDGPVNELPGSITEDETDREDSSSSKPEQHAEEITEDNKENVEVPMTVSRNARLQEKNITQSSPLAPSAFRSTRVTRASQARLHSDEFHADSIQDVVGHSSLDSEMAAVVADSQTSQQRARRGVSPRDDREQTGPVSSGGSQAMIPQSQPMLSLQDSEPSRSLQQPQKRIKVTSENVIDKNRAPPMPHSVTTTNGAWHSQHSKTSSSGLRTITDPSDPLSHGQRGHLPTGGQSDTSSAQQQQATGDQGSMATGLGNKLVRKDLRQGTKSTSHSDSTVNRQNSAPVSTYYETAREPSSRSFQDDGNARKRLEQSGAKSRGESASKASHIQDMSDVEDMNFDLLGDDDHEFYDTMKKLNSTRPSPRKPRSAHKKPTLLATRSSTRRSSDAHTFHSPVAPAFSQLTPPQSSSQELEVQTAPEIQENTTEHVPEQVTRASPIQRPPQSPPPTTQSDDSEPVHAPRRRRSPGVITPTSFSQVVRQTTLATTHAPNRVFAHFNGQNSNYFPATCVGATQDEEPRYEVIFDDGNRSVVSAYGIKRLELRAGDVCKVDAQGTRTGNFVVKEMRGHITETSPADPTPGTGILSTDQLGHSLVALAPKSGKRKRSTDSEDREDEDDLVAPIWRVYFTQTMWGHFKDRAFTFSPSVSFSALPQSLAPSSTPFSLLRAKRGRSFVLNASRTHTAPSTPNTIIFSDMAFALTNIAGNGVLNHLSTNIKHHGGRILEAGFDELFQIPSLSRTTSPSKHDPTTFSLKPSSKDLGFVGLIADRHCRRAKFIQALALGIPCIATRWVTDCIAKATLLPISPYLLPSGESTHLNGAVRSRVFATLPDPNNSTLNEIFDARPKMLDGASVILIMQKTEEQIMSHHNFLTHALGAARVIRASSAENAAKAARDSTAGWDYVFSYDRERETERIVLGSVRGAAASGKKRADEFGHFGQRRAQVVGNEYVIQSLILGQLIDA